jgi:hypothetical protein
LTICDRLHIEDFTIEAFVCRYPSFADANHSSNYIIWRSEAFAEFVLNLGMRTAVEQRKCREHWAPTVRSDITVNHHATARADEIRTGGTNLIAARMILVSGRSLGQLGLILRVESLVRSDPFD